MAPVKAGKYEYQALSLVSLRKKLGYTQTRMANLLGIPSNTLSRWETGATTPDAESLAAIYSIGMAKGITPNFFERKRAVPKTPKGRSRLLAVWDCRGWLQFPGTVPRLDRVIRQYLHDKCPKSPYPLYKAFVDSSQGIMTDKLESLGWRVCELDAEDIDDEIVQDARSDCGHAPGATTLVLITQGGRFEELVHELSGKNVDLRLISSLARRASKLMQAVPESRRAFVPM